MYVYVTLRTFVYARNHSKRTLLLALTNNYVALNPSSFTTLTISNQILLFFGATALLVIRFVVTTFNNGIFTSNNLKSNTNIIDFFLGQALLRIASFILTISPIIRWKAWTLLSFIWTVLLKLNYAEIFFVSLRCGIVLLTQNSAAIVWQKNKYWKLKMFTANILKS